MIGNFWDSSSRTRGVPERNRLYDEAAKQKKTRPICTYGFDRYGRPISFDPRTTDSRHRRCTIHGSLASPRARRWPATLAREVRRCGFRRPPHGNMRKLVVHLRLWRLSLDRCEGAGSGPGDAGHPIGGWPIGGFTSTTDSCRHAGMLHIARVTTNGARIPICQSIDWTQWPTTTSAVFRRALAVARSDKLRTR